MVEISQEKHLEIGPDERADFPGRQRMNFPSEATQNFGQAKRLKFWGRHKTKGQIVQEEL